MKLCVLALDYDGTIAEEGRLVPEARAALEEAREKGIVVVLVTGRTLSDLRCALGDLRIFDAIVAENGAVASFPRSGHSARLAAPASQELRGDLERRGIEVRAGECILELEAAAAGVVLERIHALQLPLTLHFNRARLMVLPQAVSKATGLREALRTLRLSVHNALALGDAENDHELLRACEVGAAVAWGSAVLRAAADLVVPGEGPRDVAPYVRSIAAGPRVLSPPVARRNVVLGRDAAGELVTLSLKGRNVLIAGDPRSGKSWVGGLLCEQLVLQGYCVCLIDPEGDYEPLEALPGVVLLGGEDPPPSMHELVRTLRHADVSVILNLARLTGAEKRDYVLGALRTVRDLRRESGLPHRIFVDEAHYFLHEREEAALLDHELAGYTLITYRVGGLNQRVLAATEYVIVTRATDAEEARLLHERWRGAEDLEHWRQTLAGLDLDEAVLLPGGGEGGQAASLRRFRLAPRLTYHVRHRHKYMDVPAVGDKAFRFAFDDGAEGPAVRSLRELIDVLVRTPVERIEGHVRRGDLSRWVADVLCDERLAERLRDFEERHRLGGLPDFNGAVVYAIQRRYVVPGEVV